MCCIVLFMLCLWLQSHSSRAVRLPLVLRSSSSSFVRRSFDPKYGANSSGFQTSVGADSVGNVYTTEITVGAQEFTVQLDTGSSDLWVYSPNNPVQLTNVSGIFSNLSFGIGSVLGSVDFTEVKVGPYVVPSQAFVNVTEFLDEDSLFDHEIHGILGLSFDGMSKVDDAIQSEWGEESTLGQTFLSNVFHQNSSTPNYISFMLGRPDDLGGPSNGTFTIGEYLPQFAAISDNPKLPVVMMPNSSPQWNVIMDGLRVNGESFNLNSSATSIPQGSSIALLDSGTSDALIPQAVFDFIYGNIPGAVYIEDLNVYAVPCLTSINVTFLFGHQDIPIHPLDLVHIVSIPLTNGSNITACLSTYTPSSILANPDFGDIDFLLGDAFLRNVYAVFDFGDYDKNGNVGDPYVQLLATTNLSEAIQDFTSTRGQALKSSPPVISPAELASMLNPTTPDSDGDEDEAAENVEVTKSGSESGGEETAADAGSSVLSGQLHQYGQAILGLLAGNLLVGIVLCIIGILMCVRRGVKRGVSARSLSASYAPLKLKTDNPSATQAAYDAEGYSMRQ